MSLAATKPCDVGGQAVLEGVMMRSPRCLAIAVRKPSGEIVVKEDVWVSIWEKLRFLRWPFLRGGVVLFESMHNGIKALSFSARHAGLEDEGVKPDATAPATPEKEPTSLAITLTIVTSLAFGLGLFVALPHFLTWLFGKATGSLALQGGTAVAFHLVDGVIKMAIFIGYLWGISRMKEIHRVFQYHGAEHKSIYTYEKGLALTVDNARAQTRLHPRCGTSFLLIVLMTSILVFSMVTPFLPLFSETKWLNHLALVFVKIPLMFPIAGLAYEATKLSARRPNHPLVRAFVWPGLMLQKITTQEPDDSQLEVALAALKMTLWREEVGTDTHRRDADDVQTFPSYDALASAFSA